MTVEGFEAAYVRAELQVHAWSDELADDDSLDAQMLRVR